jgi:pimeloyl-ACP methyl ester carboxylesterase
VSRSLDLTRSDGGRLALHHLGGEGRPLLVSHATGFHAHCYRELVARLSPGRAVWALDYRGHGFSPRPVSDPTNWDGFAQDVTTAARHIAPDGGLDVLGHSMGGAAVLLASLGDSALFGRLLAFEPIAPPPVPDLDVDSLPIVQGAVRRRPGFDSLDAALDNYSGKRPLGSFDPGVLRDYVEFGFEDTPEGGVLLRCRPEFEAAVFRSAHETDLWARLPEVTLATTVLAGVVEEHQPSSFARAVAERMPSASFVQTDDFDHFGPFTVPGVFATYVERLLALG